MTTAHRPTWKAAVGQANEGGWSAGGAASHQVSALDAPGHTRLKVRSSSNPVLLDSVEALRAAEQQAQETRKQILQQQRPIDPENEKRAKLKLLKQTAEIDVEKLKAKYDDSDIDDGGGGTSESDLDADDDSDDGDSNSSSDDDEDDEAALQAELAKIRAEREEAKRKAAEAEENEKEQAAAVMGNPLLNTKADPASSTSSGIKRRWNDDVVFRNQAKGEASLQPKKRFTNDTVRNEFHKKFLNKFIR